MSLDFFVTQFYRLMVHDMVLMSDVYWFYSQNRKDGKSLQEFSEILANLLEIESQNFDEINTAKLSIGEGEGVALIVWDYLKDVILKHLLDDASQFPFWASKMIVTSQPVRFGMPVIRAYGASLQHIYFTRGVKGLFEGSMPYMFASCYHNYRFLLKVTHAFISNVFSKIPHSRSMTIEDDLSSPMGSPKGTTRKSLRDADTPFPKKDALSVIDEEEGSSTFSSTFSTFSMASAATSTHGTHSESTAHSTSNSNSNSGLSVNMPRHKTRSNADLSVLMGGEESSTMNTSPRNTSTNATSSAVSTVGVVNSPAGASETSKPFSKPATKTTAINANTGNTGGNTSSKSNTSVGSFALGTSGKGGAPKGFVSMGPSNGGSMIGYPTMRVAGDGHYSSVSTIRPKKSNTALTTDTVIMRQLQKACVAVMTHPLMVLSASIVKNPFYQGQSSIMAFFKMVSNMGISGLYTGFRARFVLSLVPLSPLVMMGVADTIVYHSMDGKGSMDSTGGVFSALRYIISEGVNSDGTGSVTSLFNYGLLTAVHVVPGFLSFVAMRSLSWLVLGSSLNRKHQISRRKEIVEAHINLIDKKSPYE